MEKGRPLERVRKGPKAEIAEGASIPVSVHETEWRGMDRVPLVPCESTIRVVRCKIFTYSRHVNPTAYFAEVEYIFWVVMHVYQALTSDC